MRCLSTLTLCALASACVTVGPDFKPPKKPDVTAYEMPGDDATAPAIRLAPSPEMPANWWSNFNSPALDALVREALANNQTLAEADANLDRARAAYEATRGEALPQVNGTAGVTRERINLTAFGFAGPSPTLTLYSIGPSVSFDLDIFGGRRRATEREGARAVAESARVDAAYLTLSGNVVRQAVLIAGLRAKIATLEDIVAGDQRTLNMVRRAIEAGGQPQSAANAADSQLAEDQAQLPPLRQQLAEARHRLALLVGRMPGNWRAPDLDLTQMSAPRDIPVTLPSELVRRRPDILAAEADLHAATAEIGVATAALYPQLSLNASILQGALDPDQIFTQNTSGWNIGPSLTAPLFHGGTLRANVRGARAAAVASYAAYQQTVLTAFVQVADVMQAVGHDQDTLAAQQRAVDAAAANQRTAEVAYENGAGALLPVIDAQRQARRARSALIDAQAQLLSDVATLYVASAADWRRAGK